MKGLNALASLGIVDPYYPPGTVWGSLYPALPEFGGLGPIPIGVTPQPATALTPAQQAQAERDSLTAYQRQVGILKTGGLYDFGEGSTRRNTLFSGDRGLSGLSGWWEQADPPGRAVITGVFVVLAILIIGGKK